MATPSNMEEPLKYKTWVLKVSIHCKGCKRKVIKVLSSIQGVHNFDVDLKLQRVVVSGNIDADTLIYKLIKSGRNAELWPELYNQKQGKSDNKEKRKEKPTIVDAPSDAGHGDKEEQGSGKVADPATPEPNDVAVGAAKVVQAENATSGVPTTKINQAGTLAASVPTTTKLVNGLTASNPSTTKLVNQTGGLTASIPNTTKSVNQAGSNLTASIPAATKLVNQTGSNLTASIPATTKLVNQAASATAKVKQDGGGEEMETAGNKAETGSSGSSIQSNEKSVGKKKKKKGQNGNTPGAEEQSRIEEASSHNAWMGPHNKNSVTPPTANNNPPRQFENQYPPTNYYAPPGPTSPPVYVMSYNMAHPTPSYTTSYYSSPTPFPSSSHYSYSYSRYHEPPHTVEPPPSYHHDSEAAAYVRQQPQSPPLDSFELFSDENPNGCSVM